MKRDSFIFYRSFYEALSSMPEKERLVIYEAIAKYSLNEEEPELEGIAKTIWLLMLPNLKANNQRFKNGNKPKQKQKRSETEAKQKQKVTKTEANKDKDKDVDKDKDILTDGMFEKWFTLYAKEINKSKCARLWRGLSTLEKEKALKHTPAYVNSKPDKFYRKNPDNYLFDKTFNDEVIDRKDRGYEGGLNLGNMMPAN